MRSTSSGSIPAPESSTVISTPSCAANFGFHTQQPLALRRRRHRVYCIDRQIQDDLLQLNSVAEDLRQLVGEFAVNDTRCFCNSPCASSRTSRNEIVDIDRPDLLLVLLEHCPDGIQYVTCPMAVPDNAFENLPYLVEIGRRSCEPSQSGIGACDHGRQRLLYLVADRGRHRPHCRELRDARKLRMCRAQRQLRAPAHQNVAEQSSQFLDRSHHGLIERQHSCRIHLEYHEHVFIDRDGQRQ